MARKKVSDEDFRNALETVREYCRNKECCSSCPMLKAESLRQGDRDRNPNQWKFPWDGDKKR